MDRLAFLAAIGKVAKPSLGPTREEAPLLNHLVRSLQKGR